GCGGQRQFFIRDRFSPRGMHLYVFGPLAFMQYAAKQLVDRGVNKDNIH
ncbi:hypothetical protein ACVGWC_20850, partial [Enterobacter hormaechei]